MTNTHPLHVTLLGNDPADGQWSILGYGEALQKALSTLDHSFHVTLKAPQTTRSLGWMRHSRVGRAAAMYLSRYVWYPRILQNEKSELYHFLDYGNAWAIQNVDPHRVVITCHDMIPLIFRKERGSLIPWLSDLTYHHALNGLKKAAAVISVSERTRHDLIEHVGYPPQQIHVIPLGIDPDFKPLANANEILSVRAEFRLPKGIILLHVGQNLFYKNIEGALRCIKILQDRKIFVWLARVGPGLNKKQMRLALSLNIADKILEFGPLPKEKLRRLYPAVDLLIQPSWYEGLGLPPLEAMACGVPVVVSNRGALPETAGNAALIADPDRPESFADAAQKIISDSSFKVQLRARGLERASQFNWQKTAEQTVRVYHSVFNK